MHPKSYGQRSMTYSEVILYPCSEVDWLGLWAAKDFLKLKGVLEENTIFNVVTANIIHQANLPKLHIVSVLQLDDL